jgi:uncharacterized iron-regulated membrane protein
MSRDSAFYRMIWRWHFYAGLFVIPFVLILSVTGAFYLFKPQVERWEERAFQGLPTDHAVTPDQQREAALAAFPGTQFHSYRLPEQAGDAAMIHLTLPGGSTMRDVFVSPQGTVLGSFDPQSRLIAIDEEIHGQLLMGEKGSWLVELAASWAIVMVLTGLYLWWPDGRGLAGVVWPRLNGGRRVFWRDLHAVTGFWVSGLALVLLVTGLPWASAWGSLFKAVRSEVGWIKGKQDWTLGGRAVDAGEHAKHDHGTKMAGAAGEAAMASHSHHAMAPVRLSEVVARAASERLAFPVMVSPPANDQPHWTAKSDAQNRPQRVTITYDAMTGAQLSREGFADKHPVDRVVGYGIAWHEGQLFGAINQLIGLATALMLITLVVSGFVMWRRRKPAGLLGAPPLPTVPAVPARIRGVAALILLLAALLPLLAASLIVLWLAERLILPRIPPVARWLGMRQAA